MGIPSEDELLRAARRFDRQALAEIYDCYSPVLYTYAMRLLGNPELAEECVADTFQRFLLALRAGGGPDGYLKAYLYRIAHNWITDLYRRQPPQIVELSENVAMDASTNPENAAETRLEQERVRSALRCLTADQRQVIVLRFLEELSIEQTARALGKPLGAVKSLQHRALTALARLLEDRGKEQRL
ncbi:MAG: sigma-70 family RNA polymerase sigma factor [Anaerolineales bacterium]|jgi:RNA polymerase sigma-70 factor (ECF subfamily)